MSRARPYISHERCLQSPSCVAHDIDSEQFVIRHITPDCTCESVGIEEKDMMEILAKGEIPLVDCSLLPSGNIKVRLSKFERHSKYIAVSHVSMRILWYFRLLRRPNYTQYKLVV